MSTIVAIHRNAEYLLAADTLVTSGPDYSARQRPRAKIIRFADSLIGVTGFSVYTNILDHWLGKRNASADLDNENSILEFVLAFWRDLKQDYHFVQDSPNDDNDPSPFADLQAEFLIVNRHGIFNVREILSVSAYDGFCAIGSGAPYASGALAALWDGATGAAELARRAVQIAASFDRSTGDDVVVMRGEA